jgi:predicted nucleic acid-binding protein
MTRVALDSNILIYAELEQQEVPRNTPRRGNYSPLE